MMYLMTVLLILVSGVVFLLWRCYALLVILSRVMTDKQAVEYVKAAETPKRTRKVVLPRQTDTRGRKVEDTLQLTDLADLDFDQGIQSIIDYAEGN